MNDEEMDLFLRRAVSGAVGMMRSGAGDIGALLAFHYAIGLAVQGPSSIHGKSIPRITKDGFDLVHATAHQMADEGVIDGVKIGGLPGDDADGGQVDLGGSVGEGSLARAVFGMGAASVD